VPLVAAAVCPHPPLLIPALAAGAAPELDDLRVACDHAVAALREAVPDRVVIVGTGARTARVAAPALGSLAPFGLGLEVALAPARQDRHNGAEVVVSESRIADRFPEVVAAGSTSSLPLSLTIGAWLLHRGPVGCPVAAQSVAADATPVACAEIGRGLGATAERVALLVMGDGSAARGEKAPVLGDPRAEQFDASVTKALAEADLAALLALDVALAAALVVAGRAAWQVLAGAAGEAQWHGKVRYDAAPYGVNYTVASWSL
jgi:hypothetical protein